MLLTNHPYKLRMAQARTHHGYGKTYSPGELSWRAGGFGDGISGRGDGNGCGKASGLGYVDGRGYGFGFGGGRGVVCIDPTDLRVAATLTLARSLCTY